MQLVTGHQTVIHSSILVVCNLAPTVESLEWVTTVVTHTDLTDSTVTVSITKDYQQVLHSSELLVFLTDKDSVGCVAVAGQFPMDTEDKVRTVTTVEDAVDKADKVDLDLLRSHTSKPNKKICQKRVIDPLFL